MSATKEVHQIDQEYKGYKPFGEWLKLHIDETRWESLKSRIEALRGSDEALLKKALHVARRAAAFESGAVEDLYKTDRGITMTIATEAAEWEKAVNATNQPKIVHDQLDAYEGLLDLVTQKVPITQAGIRELHTRLCKSQETYLVHTPSGPQKQQLYHGKYKTHANHVEKEDGTYHAYAPVDMVAPEMERLCSELRGEQFSSAHAVLQAAYSHHALTVIHPFPDGNGRVVRAIASVYLYRDARIPFLFFLDQKSDYFNALAAADNHTYQSWIDFVFESGLQTMLLVEQTFKSAGVQDVAKSLKSIDDLYVTKSGFTHDEIDAGALRLISLVQQNLQEQLANILQDSDITFNVSDNAGTQEAPSGYRNLIQGNGRIVVIVTNERRPAMASYQVILNILVPRDADTKDSLILWYRRNNTIVFEARIDELIPKSSTSVQIRSNAFVDGLVSKMIQELADLAREAASKTN